MKKIISCLILGIAILFSSGFAGSVSYASEVSKTDLGTYSFTLGCMKDKVDELSMAGTYVEPKGKLEKTEDGNYMIVKFMRSDWMKQIEIEVDGQNVPHEEIPDKGTEFFLKFKVPEGKSKIRVKLFVVPMEANVAFRIVPNDDYVKSSDGGEVSADQNAPGSKLPKTGSKVDTELFIGLGVISAAIGIVLAVKARP